MPKFGESCKNSSPWVEGRHDKRLVPLKRDAISSSFLQVVVNTRDACVPLVGADLASGLQLPLPQYLLSPQGHERITMAMPHLLPNLHNNRSFVQSEDDLLLTTIIFPIYA